jgi:hypothetical protein
MLSRRSPFLVMVVEYLLKRAVLDAPLVSAVSGYWEMSTMGGGSVCIGVWPWINWLRPSSTPVPRVFSRVSALPLQFWHHSVSPIKFLAISNWDPSPFR